MLYDDRDVRPGVKFADADLRGMPLRVTISDRSIAQGVVELKRRSSAELHTLPIPDAVAAVKQEIASLQAEVLPQP